MHYSKDTPSPVYWFKCSADIALETQKGDWVLCDTVYGPHTGIVFYPPICLVRKSDMYTMKEILCFHELRPIMQKIEWTEELPF
jgi:hypothetical protein